VKNIIIPDERSERDFAEAPCKIGVHGAHYSVFVLK
jgi:hypothetical protein